MLCVQLNEIEVSHLFPCSLTVVLASELQTYQYPYLETQEKITTGKPLNVTNKNAPGT